MSDSDTSLTELFDKWTCDNCKEKAKSPLELEEQLLPGEKVFLVDSNNGIWLYCWGCGLRFHLKCVFDLTLDMTEEDIGLRYVIYRCAVNGCDQRKIFPNLNPH